MTTPLAQQIMIRMKAKNLTIPYLEKKAGLTNHSVRNIVRGRSLKPNAETLNGIARALGCTIEDLLEKELPQEKALPEPKQEKAEIPYKHPKLLRATVNFVTTFLELHEHDLTLEQVLNCIKIIYQGALEKDPPGLNEQDAAFWMILATDKRKGA